jgi:hypothetical protein
MGMGYRTLAALSALVVVSGVALVSTSQQAGAQQEFSLVATQTNFAVIPAGGAATINPSSSYVPNTGDEVSFRDTLTQGTATVGFDTVICTDTFNNNGLCTDVISITNVGDIHLTALVRGLFTPFSSNSSGPSTFDATIDGGTFAYANATGYMHGVDVNSNVTDYTLFLN